MKKTLQYLVILLVLCGSIYFLWTKHNDNPYGKAEAGFNIKDTASIGKIFIASFDGSTLLLERTDSCWLLNKDYKALVSMTKMLLNTLYQQEPLYPVSKSAKNIAMKDLSTFGNKVEVYDRKGKIIAKFYVGGEAPNSSGSVMIMEGSNNPYIVHIPGFGGTLTTRYAGKFKDWRDRTVFNLLPEDIKSISINYHDKPEHSFVFLNENNQPKVIGAGANENKFKPCELNMHNAGVYLHYFSEVSCEGYLNGADGLDSSIMTADKHSEIDINTKNGRHQHVEVFWMPVNKRSKNLRTADNTVSDNYDPDRLFALINNNKDTVLIQQLIFKRIFRKLPEFYQKGDTTGSKKPL